MTGAEFRYPPAGVATAPADDRGYVPLKTAARRLHMDHRTVQSAVIAGEIEGWARPGPQRLRWFVYEDQLAAGPDSGPEAEVAALRAEVAALRADLDAVRSTPPLSLDIQQVAAAAVAELRAEVGRATAGGTADLRAEVMALRESNLLLLAAHDELGTATTALQSAGDKYRQALALFLTPGHPGELPNG